MKLFSVCRVCDWSPKPYDGKRHWGDFDKCVRCGEVMDVWTESGVRNEEARLPALGVSLDRAKRRAS